MEFSKETAELYKKPKCSKCNNFGYFRYQTGLRSRTIKNTEPIYNHMVYCDCVLKNYYETQNVEDSDG